MSFLSAKDRGLIFGSKNTNEDLIPYEVATYTLTRQETLSPIDISTPYVFGWMAW